jgi:hypothetical protein
VDITVDLVKHAMKIITTNPEGKNIFILNLSFYHLLCIYNIPNPKTSVQV